LFPSSSADTRSLISTCIPGYARMSMAASLQVKGTWGPNSQPSPVGAVTLKGGQGAFFFAAAIVRGERSLHHQKIEAPMYHVPCPRGRSTNLLVFLSSSPSHSHDSSAPDHVTALFSFATLNLQTISRLESHICNLNCNLLYSPLRPILLRHAARKILPQRPRRFQVGRSPRQGEERQWSLFD
jgi:hypothetical protein